MTPWVSLLIAANMVMFLLQQTVPQISFELMLVPELIPLRPWTAITYMFLHAGWMHILFNMLGLFFFGPPLEHRLGSRHFITLYMIAGLSGAVVSAVFPFTRDIPIVGASGAVYGVMLGYAWFWPREPIYLWFVMAVEARWLVIAMTVLSLLGGITGAQDGTAHFAHLGGFLGGWLYLRWLQRWGGAAQWRRKAATPAVTPRPSGTKSMERWRRINPEVLHPVNREEYDRVMAKLEAGGGPAALSPGEREFLDRFSPP
jgi:rhomboid family protein